jgi:two-component system phosphate regulon sensor histidine kinase PhoR
VTFRTRVFLAASSAVVAAVATTGWILWAIAVARALRPGDVLMAAGAGVIAGAVTIAVLSAPWTRRLRALEDRAVQYAKGGVAVPTPAFGADEIGTVARMSDAVTQDVAKRLAGLEADRTRMAAILSGMIEGVLVVNEHGRLQLANDAARRMLRIDDAAEGRHYPEIIRHPAVAQQIAAALGGKPTASVELTGLRDPAVTLMARTAPVDVSPGRGAVVVLHDITDLRRTDRIRATSSPTCRTSCNAADGYCGCPKRWLTPRRTKPALP